MKINPLEVLLDCAPVICEYIYPRAGGVCLASLLHVLLEIWPEIVSCNPSEMIRAILILSRDRSRLDEPNVETLTKIDISAGGGELLAQALPVFTGERFGTRA